MTVQRTDGRRQARHARQSGSSICMSHKNVPALWFVLDHAFSRILPLTFRINAICAARKSGGRVTRE